MSNERWDSRRHFLQQLGGLGAGALAIGAFGAFGPFGLMGATRRAQAAGCAPPGNPTNPAPWKRDCRPIRARRPASTLSPAEISKLKAAYKAMRDLAASDPSDPRGFDHQANIHCWNCGGSVQVHSSWQFFAWHRAYLYFHERILGKLVGDMEFRLPYWDWDNGAHRKLPPAYVTPNNATNPLFNGTRGMTPTDVVPDEDVGDDVMDAALTAADFTEFGGSATAGGIPEGAPHGSVHVDVGGDMSFFNTAARDPIFYAHHSNVDKIWSDWVKADSSHDNPTAAAFLNLTFTFFDENKQWRSIKASQLLDHESKLRYVYGPSQALERLLCWHPWRIVRVPKWRAAKTIELTPDVLAPMLKVSSAKGLVRLHLDRPDVPLTKSAVYRVYADAKDAQADPGPNSPAYLGTVPVVLNDRENHHRPKPPRAVLNISRRLPGLIEKRAAPGLFYVERGLKPDQRKVSPLRAADAFFSVAEFSGG